VPRRAVKVSDIDSCGLTLSELQELWLGAHPTTGSCFRTREELVAAWQAGRAVVMRLWGSHGRRPRGFYEFEWPGDPPAYDVERSCLWRSGVLGPEEKLEVEREWRREFETAQAPNFSVNTGDEIAGPTFRANWLSDGRLRRAGVEGGNRCHRRRRQSNKNASAARE